MPVRSRNTTVNRRAAYYSHVNAEYSFDWQKYVWKYADILKRKISKIFLQTQTVRYFYWTALFTGSALTLLLLTRWAHDQYHLYYKLVQERRSDAEILQRLHICSSGNRFIQCDEALLLLQHSIYTIIIQTMLHDIAVWLGGYLWWTVAWLPWDAIHAVVSSARYYMGYHIIFGATTFLMGLSGLSLRWCCMRYHHHAQTPTIAQATNGNVSHGIHPEMHQLLTCRGINSCSNTPIACDVLDPSHASLHHSPSPNHSHNDEQKQYKRVRGSDGSSGGDNERDTDHHAMQTISLDAKKWTCHTCSRTDHMQPTRQSYRSVVLSAVPTSNDTSESLL